MLVNYKKYNSTYRFLIKHVFNNTSKSLMFIITKNELVPKKILEEMLTLYLHKTELKENINLIVIYKNKLFSLKHLDTNKLKHLQYKFNTRVLIKNESFVDDYVKHIFKTRIDFGYTMILDFDHNDYEVLSLKYKNERDNKNVITYNNFKKRTILKNLRNTFKNKIHNIIH